MSAFVACCGLAVIRSAFGRNPDIASLLNLAAIKGTNGQHIRVDVLHRCCTESPAMDDKPWDSAVFGGAD